MAVASTATETTKRRRAKYVLNIDRIEQLSDDDKKRLKQVAKRFAFRANDYYLSLIDWNDPDDPIRRLVIPQERELTDWGRLDASNEASITVARGTQHKYGSTVLLLVNEACGAYCRYCFRKRLFMNDNDEVSYDITPGLEYIRAHPEVSNVLLTGGDPMILQTPKLQKIFEDLRAIDHVKIIRIGTKMPAFNPFRFINDPELLELVREHSQGDRRVYFMCHFDHPRELTEECIEGLRLIQDAGAVCVNQNPIIRGITDDPEVMAELWNRLSFVGVPQYYVFQGRPTAGNEPFEVPIVEAYFKIEEAKKKCSGLAKRAKYCMSHEAGKIEIIGVDHRQIYLKFHRAKYARDEQRLIVCERDDEAYWLDQLRPMPGYRNEYYRDEASSRAGAA